jgi:hypothetical protein
MFKMLLGKGTNVLMVDADIKYNNKVENFAKQMFPDDWTMDIYTHITMPRQIALVSSEQLIVEAIQKLQEGKRIVMPFRARSDLLAVTAVIEAQCHVNSLKLYKSCGTSIADAFKNIDATLKDVQLFAFTSIVTVGANILDTFDCVFLHADNAKGCTAQNMSQMLGRPRNLRDPIIRVALPKPTGRVVTFKEMKQRLKDSKRLRMKYAELCSEPIVRAGNTINVEIEWSDPILLDILAYSLAEQETCFNHSFLRLMQLKRYPIVPLDSPAESQIDIDQAVKEVKSADKKHMARLKNDKLKEAQQISFDQLCDAYYELDRQRNSVINDVGEGDDQNLHLEREVQYDVMNTLRHYPEYYSTMTPDELDYAQKESYRAVACLKWLQTSRVHEENAQIRDYHNMTYSQLPELEPQILPAIQASTRALQLAGFGGIKDYETTLTKAGMLCHEKHITKECNKAEMLFGVPKSRSQKNPMISKLQNILKRVGHRLVVANKLYKIKVDPRAMKLQQHLHLKMDNSVELPYVRKRVTATESNRIQIQYH